ncbi:amino acid ABC transporter permease [Bordetella sp. BOR01]|uniref:amino acid ABC transporter permease n=1 Tax=Bordetella sp. BOR01 TaxID=2854779 RepID=UPI001C46080C|nr:amino acid ABC transporter permease [Bordetella sp. BOR01]MBV7482118.1 amino acid ABC transporter permease [Bordetella sp. BOR01]
MSELSQQAHAGASNNNKQRRLNIGGMPSMPKGLFLFALAGVIAAIASGGVTIQALRGALLANGHDGWWVSAGTVLLALAAILVALPLFNAFRWCRKVSAAARRNDVVAARIARSEACTYSWIALGYTLAQLIVVLLAQFLLANNQTVAKTFFFVPLIVQTFPLVLDAFWINVKIFVISEIFVLIWGLVVALAMFAPGPAGKPLRLLATAYVDVFRSIPAVLVIYLVGFGLPLTGVVVLKDLSSTSYVVIALTLTVGAYVAEIYRAGIQSIHWSQTAAARSLGLSHMQTLRFVVLPQGIRQIIPPLLNAFIALQKDTALVNVVGVIDSFNQSMVIASNYYNLSAATTVALLFIVISVPQTRFVERMAKRDRARMRAGGA